MDPQKGGVTDFFASRGGVTDFSGNVLESKINVRGNLGQANFKNFRRFAPQNRKFVFEKTQKKYVENT